MPYIAAIDQGTTSSRCLIFDERGVEMSRHQREHRQILPQPGWVEHDPMEIVDRTYEAVASALANARLSARDLMAIGITNQRETTVVWNPKTGRPWCNAIVWQDMRTAAALAALEPRAAWLRERTGLPPATYFSAGKLQWVLEHVPGVREAAARGDAICGTVDSWVIWNLTGGTSGGRHVTDVTNASRTQLMNLRTLAWDAELLELFGVPKPMLPDIAASSDRTAFSTTRRDGPLGADVPICGVLGDQQAAMLGQTCLAPGDAKNTYGTGNFLLLNTGAEIVPSAHGLLTTVCFAQGGHGDPPLRGDNVTFALEGSVAVTGAAVQWLRDQLGIIATAADIEPLAQSVSDNGGVYFVPAFSGLFAPYWRPDARGVVVGLTRYSTKAHLARATLEAICFQTRAVLDAMTEDSKVRLASLNVDGGATVNDTLMQMQADILGVPVVRPVVQETTALGAAYAAGLAAGVWPDARTLRSQWKEDRRWEPRWSADQRDRAYSQWQRAVERSMNWV